MYQTGENGVPAGMTAVVSDRHYAHEESYVANALEASRVRPQRSRGGAPPTAPHQRRRTTGGITSRNANLYPHMIPFLKILFLMTSILTTQLAFINFLMLASVRPSNKIDLIPNVSVTCILNVNSCCVGKVLNKISV